MATFFFSVARRATLFLCLVIFVTFSSSAQVVPVATDLHIRYSADQFTTTFYTMNGLTVYSAFKNQISPGFADAVQLKTPIGTYNPVYSATALNSKPSIAFDGINDYLEILPASQADDLFHSSSSGYTKKSIFMVFKTGSDVDASGTGYSTAKVLFEQGGVGNGINIYIKGGALYFYVYSDTKESVVSIPVTTNQVYQCSMVFNGTAGLMEIYVNGSYAGSISNVLMDKINASTDYNSIGSAYGNTRFYPNVQETHTSPITPTHFFQGYISEFLYYNAALTRTQREQTEKYLLDKYTITAPVKSILSCIDLLKPQALVWYKEGGVTFPSPGIKWADQSGYNLNATEISTSSLPSISSTAINNKPALNFSGTTSGLKLPSTNLLNAAGNSYPSRSYYFVLQPTDVTTTQVVYKEGNTNKGLNIFITNGRLYTILYNGATETTLPYVNIAAGAPIIVSVVINGSQNLTMYVNGQPVTTSLSFDLAYNNASSITLGSSDATNGCYFGALGTSTAYNPYKGYIADFAIFDRSFNTIEKEIVNHTLALKYGISLVAGYSRYRWSTDFYTSLAGIGNTNTTEYNRTSCSGIFTVSEENQTDGLLALLAENTEVISSGNIWKGFNSNTENAPLNVFRSKHSWRADVWNGNVVSTIPKQINYSFASSSFPFSLSGYQKPVLIVDSDGDFRNGAKIYVLTLASGTYTADHIPTSAGDFISFGVLNNYEYSFVGSPTYSGTIDVFGLADRGYSKNSLSSSAINLIFPSSLNTGDYMLLADNGGSLSFANTTNVPAPSYMTSLNRYWKVNKYKEVGTVGLEFNPALVSGFTSLATGDDFVLLIDETGTGSFNSGTKVVSLVYQNGAYRVFNETMTLKDGYIFTIALAHRPAVTKTKNTTFTLLESSSAISNQFSSGNMISLVSEDITAYPATLPCVQTLTKATLNLTFNTGDDYLFGETAFGAQLIFDVLGRTTEFGPINTVIRTCTLAINNNTPEQFAAVDVSSYFNMYPYKEIAVKINSFTNPGTGTVINQTIKNSLVFKGDLVMSKTTLVQTTPSTLIKTQTTSFISVNKACQFNWTTEFCVPKSYEFQLLRLYNTQVYSGTANSQNMYNADLDWSKALSIEVAGTSLTLTLAEGTGYYIWRVRPIGNYYDGGIANNQNWGNWSSDKLTLGSTVTILSTDDYLNVYKGSVVYYNQFDEDKNFIYSRVFTEGGNIHEGMTYANGLQQATQTQAKVPSNGTTGQIVVSEMIPDLSGRPALQSLAAPDEAGDNLLGYRPLALTTGSGTKYSAYNFDQDANYVTTDPLGSSLINLYYSNSNTDPQIPNAENYPYSRVLNDNDGLNRPLEQSGVGPVHKIGQKTVKIAYSAVNDAELIRMFGDEAPKSNSVYKTLTTDQNGVTSVSYTDKEGKVLATALVRKASQPGTNLIPLDNTGTEYEQTQKIDNNTDLTDGGVKAAKPLVLTEATDVTISVTITQPYIQSDCGVYCATCSYKAVINLIDQSTGLTYYTNTLPFDGSVVPCSTATDVTAPTQNVTLSQVPAGKYLVQKIITLDTDKATTYAAQVTDQINTNLKSSAVYTNIQTYLTNTDIDGLNTYLLGIIGTTSTNGIVVTVEHPAQGYTTPSPYRLIDGDKVVLTSPCCSLKIPIMVPNFDPCKQLETSSNIDDFSAYMISKYKEVNGGVFDLPFAEISSSFDESTFQQLITNMYFEPVLYHDATGKFTCQKIWDTWNGLLQTKGLNANFPGGYGATQVEPGQDNLTGQPGWVTQSAIDGAASSGNSKPFIDQFLDGVGRNYTGFLVSNTDYKLKAWAYKYFYYAGRSVATTVPNYGNATQEVCENVFCKTDNPALIDRCNTHMCNRKVMTISSPYGTFYKLYYESTTAGNYVELSSTVDNNQYNQLYLCVKNLPSPMPTNTQLQHNTLLPLVIDKKKSMQDDCNGACDNKRTLFLQKLKKLYDPTSSGIYTNGAGSTFPYEDLCCTADRLVEYCKDQCYLSVIKFKCPSDANDPIKLLSIGTVEENNTLLSILYGDFEITDPTNTTTPCTNIAREAKVCYQSAGLYHLENTTDVDASGSFASLVVSSSSVLTPDRFGVANKAYNLNNGYAAAATDNSRSIINNVTVSAWVQRTADNTGSTERPIVQKFDGTKGFKLYTKGDYVYFDVYDNIGLKSSGASLSKLPLSSGSEWHFVTGIARDTSIEVWIDGEFVTGLYGVTVGSFSNTASVTIGHPTAGFAGKVDEVYLYACPMGKGAVLKQYQNTLYEDLDYSTEPSVNAPCFLPTDSPSKLWDVACSNKNVYMKVDMLTIDGENQLTYGCQFTESPYNVNDYAVLLYKNKKIKEFSNIGGATNTKFSHAIVSSDNHYILLGEKWISSTSSTLYLVKMARNGRIIWQNSFTNSSLASIFSSFSGGDHLKVVEDNNVLYVISTSEFGVSSTSINLYRYKLSDGTLVNSTLSINNMTLPVTGTGSDQGRVFATKGGGYLYVTKSCGVGSANNMYLAKINLSTWILTGTSYYGTDGKTEFVGIDLMNNNNNILVRGITTSDLVPDRVNIGSSYAKELYLANINANSFVLQWEKAVGVLGLLVAYQVSDYANGAIYTSKLDESTCLISCSFGNGNSDIGRLLKVSIDGSYTNNFDNGGIISYTTTSDGYVLMTSNSSSGYNVVKLNNDFKTVWTRNINIQFGSYNPSSIRVFNNNAIVLGGMSTVSPNVSYERSAPKNAPTIDEWFLDLGYTTTCSRRPICLKWKLTPPPVPAPTEDPVPADDQKTSITKVINQSIITQLGECTATNQAALLAEYKVKCKGRITESVTTKYKINTEQYTLYYYDRSGNLVKTIPPEGVRLLPVSDPIANANELARKVHPNHMLETTYKYNSLGQITEQKTPDGGVTQFLYNKLGMLRFSQNAQQAIDHSYSYTKYDELGRVIEVGLGYEMVTNIPFASLNDPAYLTSPLVPFGHNSFPEPGLTSEETYTVYTSPAAHLNYLGKGQRFTQNRVSYTFTKSKLLSESPAVTCYSYDPHGNVEWLVQDVPGFSRNTIGYEYDLISNKVLKVKLNEKRADQFFHCYSYDADNRITGVKTSSNGYLWDTDARYKYYKHGPLKRTELGEDKIQGLDYTYTIHGWLKGVNAPNTVVSDDPGQDTQTGNLYGQDEYSFVLGYYDGDFSRSGSVLNSNTSTYNLASTKNLYNGNIKTWVNRIPEINVLNSGINAMSGQAYEYDYLNRIKTGTHYTYSSGSGFTVSSGAYNSSYSYDGNGNLTSLVRNGNSPSAMDNLAYSYIRDGNGKLTTNNRLNTVTDNVNPTNYNDDIDGTNDYTYDAIGNLTNDVKQLNDIKWTVYGKISEVKQHNAVTVPGKEELRYAYDASGNRIIKEMNIAPYTSGGVYQRLPDKIYTTYYVRDASGNVMAIYKRKNLPVAGATGFFEAVYTLKETPLYGSSRLGDQDERDAEVEIGRKKFYKDDLDKVQIDFSSVDKQTEAPLLLTTTSSIDQIVTSGTYKIPSVKLHQLSMTSSASTASALQSMNAIAGIQGGDVSVAELEDGTVLFYTATFKSYWGKSNVLLLFDANGKIMLNSGGIQASAGSRSVIVRQPDNDQKYLLVTRGTDGKLYSHTVDMTLKGNGIIGDSRGDVATKNNVLDAGTNYGSHLVALENYVTGVSYIYATRYTAPYNPSVLGQLEMMQFEVSAKGTSVIKKPVVMCTGIESIRELGESEMQLSPDTKKFLLYNHLKKLGWFSVQRSEVNVFNLGADFKVTGNYLVDRVRITAPPTTSSQSAEFSADSRFVYYGADRLTLTGSTPTDKELKVYDLRESINTSLSKAYNGNIRRGVTKLIYDANRADIFMPGYKQDANTAAITEGAVGDRITFSYLPAGNTLSGIVSLQNTKILRKSDWNTDYLAYSRRVGSKQYELSDHLGNVTVLVSDRKAATWPSNVLTNKAQVMVYNSYYPFGLLMPGLNNKSGDYRYGFNGKEHDTTWNDNGMTYDYGFRIYNPQIAKFLSVDPLTADYSSWSPYPFAMNRCIDGIDLDGLEWESVKDNDGVTTDYIWKGFNKDDKGNYVAPKGTVSGGTINGYTFSSDARTGTGTVERHYSSGNMSGGSVAQLSSEQSASTNIYGIYSYFSYSNFCGTSHSENVTPAWYGGWHAISVNQISGVIEAYNEGKTMGPPPDMGVAEFDLGGQFMITPWFGAAVSGTLKVTGSLLGKGVGYVGAGYVNVGLKLVGNNFLKLNPRLLRQFDIGHRATTFLRPDILSKGTLGVRNWNTIFYNYSLGGKPFSIGINPWKRSIYHEAPGVFK